MKKLLGEFKKFALKGNVIDMAVGVMIGGAFSKIVTSLVNDVFMPVLSLLTGEDMEGQERCAMEYVAETYLRLG